MRRAALAVAALAALLAAAPAASAGTYTVTSPADSGAGSLRDAIGQANASPGADAIGFAPGLHQISVSSGTLAVTDVLAIGDREGDVEVDRTGGGALLDFQSGTGSSVSGLRLVARAGGGPLVQSEAGGLTIDSLDVSGSSGDGVVVTAGGATLSSSLVHGNAGNGIAVGAGASGVVVMRTAFFANGGKPIALAPGANGGATPPQSLRIGPRMGDAPLPLTGSAPVAGTLEIWAGDPFSVLQPSFLATQRVNAGGFGYLFPSDPTPGSIIALMLTGSSGTSEVARVRVPDDIVAPIGSRLKISPAVLCVRRTRRCRKPGATVSFVSSEAGQATLLVMHQDDHVGTRTYPVHAGANRIHFNGRVNGRRLRMRHYRLLLYLKDRAGNQLTEPPITVFAVKRRPARHYNPQ